MPDIFICVLLSASFQVLVNVLCDTLSERMRLETLIRDKDAMLKIQAAQAVNRSISASYFNQSCIDTYKSEICAPYNSGDHLDR